jgi:hypothetical protein
MREIPLPEVVDDPTRKGSAGDKQFPWRKKDVEYTCDKCPYFRKDTIHNCEWAYDLYNTNGDCLAEK